MFLEPAFLDAYRKRPVKWGFPSGPNSLGELVYRRTYRRGKCDWVDTLARVTEGTFETLQGHCEHHGLPFDMDVARTDAMDFFARMFCFKWLPPGRGLWMMGTDFIKMRGSMALQSCAFVSTEFIETELDKPFRFLMDVSMLGTGCGFDTRGAGKVKWQPARGKLQYVIPDSREGWVESLGMLVRWGLGAGPEPEFSYHLIRPAGQPIKGFGGVSEGPDELKKLHGRVQSLIQARKNKKVSSRDIVDVMNMIGACVVAGNVRRTAEISFGDPGDEEFLDLKDYKKNPERGDYGWTSNNAIFARLGMEYYGPSERTRKNGEPGYAWLENMRAYGRMCDPPNHKDRRVMGGNPCVPPGTLVATRGGQFPIEQLVGKEVEVWNGLGWAKVKPKVTGMNQPLVRVTLEDGRVLTCTPGHRLPWDINYGDADLEELMEVRHLKAGDTIVDHPLTPGAKPGLVKIKSIEDAGKADLVYCFSEPQTERGTFDGIVTGQCLEQSLEHFEVCTLVETFPHHHESLEDYRRTLKYAFMYAKAVTLIPTHWKETNAVVMRNRRIGCSASGIAQFVHYRGRDTLSGWLDEGYRTVCHYDTAYSEWLGVRESIKKTSIKPSGTVSLPAGATPGGHWPEYAYYIRRVRYADRHPDLDAIREAGYHTESDVNSANTTVVEFPVAGDPDVPTQREVSLREKIEMAVMLQRVWADNQVSFTATFTPDEGQFIAPLLKEFETKLKGISFLPDTPAGAYPQMPYEAITEAQYLEMVKGLKPIVWPSGESHEDADLFCDGQACEVKRPAAEAPT